MTRSSSVEYIPLITEDHANDGNQEHAKLHKDHRSKEPRAYSRLTIAALTVSLLCFLWSLRDLFVAFRGDSAANFDVEKLRHPSLYHGLDRVPGLSAAGHAAMPGMPTPGHSGDHPATESDASLSSQGRPQTAMRVSETWSLKSFPPSRWILLTQKDHTILEFIPSRTSNTCRFTAFWPERLALQDKMLILESPKSPGQPKVTIQAHILPSQVFEATQNVTWTSKPGSGPVWRTFPAAFGTNYTSSSMREAFLCKEGNPLLIELSCVEEGCRVEYEDKAGAPQLGLQLAYQ